jgi:solute carrier family 25 carnitine/acylcarnitine transporter 20/29
MAEDAWVDFVAGWCSGAAAVVVCQPVDTVLTRYQAGSALIGAQGSTNSATNIARGLVSQAGIKSFWRGSYAMIGAVPFQNALLMSGYGLGKRLSSEENVIWGAFGGGCTGGVVQSFLMSPVELIKVRQQIKPQLGALEATKVVTQGLLSPSAWKGLGATLLRDGIPHGVWFASYEGAKMYLDKTIGGTPYHDSFTIPLSSGAFAATAAWVSEGLCNNDDIFSALVHNRFSNVFFCFIGRWISI